LELARKFPAVQTDTYVIMPNHVHGIIVISDPDTDGPVGADLRVCLNGGRDQQGEHAGSPLPRMVQWFKTMTTNAYMRGVKTLGWTPFSGKLWQRNYCEHIIRDNESFDRIREYSRPHLRRAVREGRGEVWRWASDRENRQAIINGKNDL